MWLRPVDVNVKLIDFGITAYNSVHNKSLISTRPYRAPEVVLGNCWGKHVDIWSMACILVELYTGNELFNLSEKDLDDKHLAMIEHICGPIPTHMYANS